MTTPALGCAASGHEPHPELERLRRHAWGRAVTEINALMQGERLGEADRAYLA